MKSLPLPSSTDEQARPRFRIRTRLALLVLALALPFAGYSIYASIQEARLEREHAGALMLSTAQITAARLDDQIGDIHSILRVLSAVVDADPAKWSENDALLRSLAGNVPAYVNNISVWTAKGELVGALDPRLRSSGTAMAERQFFRDALAGRAMSVEAPLKSLSTGADVCAFGLPIRRDGTVVGVIAAGIRLSALQDVLRAGAELPLSAVVTVINPKGVVLARSIDPERWIGKTIPPPPPGDPAVGRNGIRDGPSADGIARIAGFTTAHAAPWRVYVGVPRDEALVPVYARLKRNLLTAALILSIGLGLALAVGESVASPLRQLADDALQLGSGNLAHRSRTGSGGETGMLARTLNQMARQLQERSSALLASQEQLRQVTDNLPALISYLDVEERFRFANQLYATWLDHDPQELLGKSLLELYGPEVYDRIKPNIQRAMAGERVIYERELPTRQGLRHVEVTAVPDRGDGGQVEGLFVMMVDVSARRQAEAALLQSERRLKMVADNLPALVTYVDQEERYRFVNAYLGSIFETDPGELLGKTMRETGGHKLYAEIAPHVAAALRGEQVVFQGVWVIKEQTFHYQSSYVPDIDGLGVVRGFYAMTFDITALKETQRQLDMLARVDALTGLPNRRQFEERLHDAMARTRRSDIALALMFLDIDHFKSINDTFGHGVGDLVLKEFAARLKAQVRSTDVVARLAGDEFVILLEGIDDVDELKALSAKIVRAVREPLVLDSGPARLTTSMGVARYEGDGTTSAELLAAADRALYISKREGRDRYSLGRRGEVLEMTSARKRAVNAKPNP